MDEVALDICRDDVIRFESGNVLDTTVYAASVTSKRLLLLFV
jgi:hypothetical protein